MHLPDGLLTAPVYLPLGAITLGAIAFASGRARAEVEGRPGALPLTGVLAAFIFCAQLVNFPLPVPGVSGHLLGGVLAAALLGPWLASLAMAAVFVLQALVLGDGGVYALGANTFNMGLIATLFGSALYDALRRALAGNARGTSIAAFTAGLISVELGALATFLEIAASEPAFRGRAFLALMLGIHAVIGVFEGAITAAVLRYVERVRPDLVAAEALSAGPDRPRRALWPVLVPLAAVGAVLVALHLRDLGSEKPDGLEAALERAAPPGYVVPGGEPAPATATATTHPAGG